MKNDYTTIGGSPNRRVDAMPSSQRQFLRVQDFDKMQNPKRPRRPTWIKSFVRDLDDPIRLSLTLTVRGFLSEFEKLASTMMNRVPDDVRFIGRKINTPPAVAGKALNTCLTRGLITRFAEDMKTSQDNDLYNKTDDRPIPPSSSPSNSPSPSTDLVSNNKERWTAVDDMDIPF